MARDDESPWSEQKTSRGLVPMLGGKVSAVAAHCADQIALHSMRDMLGMRTMPDADHSAVLQAAWDVASELNAALHEAVTVVGRGGVVLDRLLVHEFDPAPVHALVRAKAVTGDADIDTGLAALARLLEVGWSRDHDTLATALRHGDPTTPVVLDTDEQRAWHRILNVATAAWNDDGDPRVVARRSQRRRGVRGRRAHRRRLWPWRRRLASRAGPLTGWPGR